MTLRLCHVPSIVSLRQLQEDAAAAGGSPSAAAALSCSWLDGSTPLASAVGACVPLYQYPAASATANTSGTGPVSRCASMAGSDSDACVPDYLGYRTLDEGAWAPKIAVLDVPQLPGDKHTDSPWATPSNTTTTIQDDAATVPVMASPKTLLASPTNGSKATALLQHQGTNCSLLNGGSVLSEGESEEDMLLGTLSESDSIMHSGSLLELQEAEAAALHAPGQRTTIDTVLTALWDDCAARGLFRYDVAACATRALPGRWGWVAQLNEGRASKKRPTELRVDAVLQPFDAAKFHFGKAFLREVLLQFEPLGHQQAGNTGLQAWAASASGARMVDSSSMTNDPTLVMINVSPIDYGHVLLTPRVLSQLPQQLEPYGVAAALAFVREVGNPSFRLGFNSLGAYATINHLHFQGYYLDAVLPCERAAVLPLPGWQHPSLAVSMLADYPVHGWVVEHKRGVAHGTAEVAMAQVLMAVCGHLQAVDQPFNLLLVDQGRRAFIWPQCYAERQAAGVVPEELLDTGVNPAVFEVAGHLVLKRAQDYAAATDEWACRLLAGVSLPGPRFAALTTVCFHAATN